MMKLPRGYFFVFLIAYLHSINSDTNVTKIKEDILNTKEYENYTYIPLLENAVQGQVEPFQIPGPCFPFSNVVVFTSPWPKNNREINVNDQKGGYFEFYVPITDNFKASDVQAIDFRFVKISDDFDGQLIYDLNCKNVASYHSHKYQFCANVQGFTGGQWYWYAIAIDKCGLFVRSEQVNFTVPCAAASGRYGRIPACQDCLDDCKGYPDTSLCCSASGCFCEDECKGPSHFLTCSHYEGNFDSRTDFDCSNPYLPCGVSSEGCCPTECKDIRNGYCTDCGSDFRTCPEVVVKTTIVADEDERDNNFDETADNVPEDQDIEKENNEESGFSNLYDSGSVITNLPQPLWLFLMLLPLTS